MSTVDAWSHGELLTVAVVAVLVGADGVAGWSGEIGEGSGSRLRVVAGLRDAGAVWTGWIDEGVVAGFGCVDHAVIAARELVEGWRDARVAVDDVEVPRSDAVAVAGLVAAATRLARVGHGGQVLVSDTARRAATDRIGDGVGFVDVGLHRLGDLAAPARVWQLRGTGLGDGFASLRSVDAAVNNLPVIMSSFVARDREVTVVRALLRADRWVTLVGSAGVGKSRLALAVAADTCPYDGVWWVELASLDDAARVDGLVAETVGIADDGRGDPLARLIRRVGDRRVLLVLDNAEHLVDAVTALARGVIESCPTARVLVTSRVPLGNSGEITWRVPPLSLPGRAVTTVEDRSELPASAAIGLFVERATRVRPTFTMTDANASDVAGICAQVRGVPLAIELAAAQMRRFGPAQVRSVLSARLNLASHHDNGLSHDAIVAGMLAWSIEQLDSADATVLRRVSVFRDGFTRSAACHVVTDHTSPTQSTIGSHDVAVEEMVVTPAAVPGALERLVQSALVEIVDDRDGRVRYRLLDAIRADGLQRLADTGELARLDARHAQWVLSRLLMFGQWALDERVFDIWSELAPELANITDAISELCATARQSDLADALAAMEPWSLYSCRYALTVRWYQPLLADTSALTPTACAWVYYRAATMYGQLGRFVDAASLLEHAGQLATDTNDTALLALMNLGHAGIAIMASTSDTITPAIDTCTVALDHPDPRVQHFARYVLTGLYAASGQPQRAQPHLDILLNTSTAPYSVPAVLLWAGTTTRMAGDIDASLRHYHRLDELTTRGGALSQPIARGGHALSAFEADQPDPDLAELDTLAADALANNDITSIAITHVRRGLRDLAAGHPHQAAQCFEIARAAAPTALWATWADTGLLMVHDVDHNPTDARTVIDRLRTIGHPVRDIIATLGDIWILLDDGHYHDAEAHAHHALDHATEHGLHGYIPTIFEVLADTAHHRQQPRVAAHLLGAAEQLRDRQGNHGSPPRHRQRRDTTIEQLRARLSLAELHDATTAGRALNLDDAIDYARRHRRKHGRPSFGWHALTPTEHKIIDGVTDGLTNQQIANRLLVSTETVKTHLKNIYVKLDINNRTQLATLTKQHPS